MTTIILKTGTDDIVVGFDDKAEIIWTDELRETYEYEVAFTAMGGDKSHLCKFVEKWDDPSQAQSRIETMLYGLQTARDAVLFAVECAECAFSATDRNQNTSKAVVVIGRCIKVAREFIDYSDVLGKLAAVEQAADSINRFEHSNTVDNVVDRELLNACRVLLGAEIRLTRAGLLRSGIIGSPHSVIVAISSSAYAIAWYEYTKARRADVLDGSPIHFFNMIQRKNELLVLLRLIDTVHDAQLEQHPRSALGGAL